MRGDQLEDGQASILSQKMPDSPPISPCGSHAILAAMPRDRPRFSRERPPDPESVAAARRLFLAVPVPTAVIDRVRMLIGQLSAEPALPVRWADAGQSHLTVQFIGEVEPERAELIRLALGPVIAVHSVFNLHTGDLGVFPSLRRPRVLWLGVHGPAHRLVSIHDDLAATLDELDIDYDRGAFHPHITLGRLRPASGVAIGAVAAEIRARFDRLTPLAARADEEPVQIPVDEVLLMRSLLDQRGARHEVVERYPLASRRARQG